MPKPKPKEKPHSRRASSQYQFRWSLIMDLIQTRSTKPTMTLLWWSTLLFMSVFHNKRMKHDTACGMPYRLEVTHLWCLALPAPSPSFFWLHSDLLPEYTMNQAREKSSGSCFETLSEIKALCECNDSALNTLIPTLLWTLSSRHCSEHSHPDIALNTLIPTLLWTLSSRHCSEHSHPDIALNTLIPTLLWTLSSRHCSEHSHPDIALNTLIPTSLPWYNLWGWQAIKIQLSTYPRIHSFYHTDTCPLSLTHTHTHTLQIHA